MPLITPNKVPVYGYARRSDGTLDRKLAAYITATPEGYPFLEIKNGRTTIRVDLPVLIEQLSKPPRYAI